MAGPVHISYTHDKHRSILSQSIGYTHDIGVSLSGTHKLLLHGVHPRVVSDVGDSEGSSLRSQQRKAAGLPPMDRACFAFTGESLSALANHLDRGSRSRLRKIRVTNSRPAVTPHRASPLLPLLQSCCFLLTALTNYYEFAYRGAGARGGTSHSIVSFPRLGRRRRQPRLRERKPDKKTRESSLACARAFPCPE